MTESCHPVTIVYPGPSPHAVDFFNAVAAHPAFDVEVLYCLDEFREREGWPRPEGKFRHEYLPRRRLSTASEFLVWNPGLISRVRRGISQKRIHLVGGGYSMPSVAAAMLYLNMRRARWFYFSEKPGISNQWLKAVSRSILLRACLRGCAGILAHSPLAEKAYANLGYPRNRIHSLPYFMNVDEFRALPDRVDTAVPTRPLRILYFGRLLPIKGPDWALEAFCGLRSVEDQWTLSIAGDGPLRGRLEGRAREANLTKVRFLGEIPWTERIRLYAEHDILLFPSRHDGWGMVVMEAMAAGLPVIGSNEAGAVAAYVKEGMNGIRINPDDHAALNRAVNWCISNRGEVARMGREARASVAQWTPEAGAEMLKGILDRAG